MKRFIGAFIIKLTSASSCLAFTTPNTRLSLQPLLSTVVEEVDTVYTPESNHLSPEAWKESTQSNISQEQAGKSYLDDGFVFGLGDSGLKRPKGKVASVVVESDSIETTPFQRGFVTSTFTFQALLAANAIHTLFEQTSGNVVYTALTAVSTVLGSWIAADFGAGVLHWSVDNYGNGRTPIMGNIIAAFQGHHSAPWTITYRGFCNNVHKLCIPFGIPTVAAINYFAGPENPMVSLFFTVFCAMEIMSQEFHKWSHLTKNEVPGIVNKFQELGIIIGRVPHAQHHIAPYDGNYCIVSGICNEKLDKSGFFRWMEHQIYKINGVEANAWKLDAVVRERTLRGDYKLNLSE